MSARRFFFPFVSLFFLTAAHPAPLYVTDTNSAFDVSMRYGFVGSDFGDSAESGFNMVLGVHRDFLEIDRTTIGIGADLGVLAYVGMEGAEDETSSVFFPHGNLSLRSQTQFGNFIVGGQASLRGLQWAVGTEFIIAYLSGFNRYWGYGGPAFVFGANTPSARLGFGVGFGVDEASMFCVLEGVMNSDEPTAELPNSIQFTVGFEFDALSPKLHAGFRTKP